MPIHPDDPGRKTVFKVNTDKLPYSQNPAPTVRQSVHPETVLCVSALAAKVCDFVVGSTKWHFGQSTKHFANYSRNRMRWVEDWVELHRHSLEEARAWAVHASDPPMNFRTHYFRFRLKYRPESEGNPSTAFTLESAQVCVHPPPSSERAALDMVMSMIETAVAEELASGATEFLGCIYWIDNQQVGSTVSYIYDYELPVNRPAHKPWFWFPQYCAERGVVFRLVGGGYNDWAPGLVAKRGVNWVWAEQSIEEFERQGIALPTVQLVSRRSKVEVTPPHIM
ncbi:hypothetical protein B0H10DRAFT_2190474 [Mycena sp. CBHHK59/15]|nr:hypothetical protein B0H10DRAFT_2190474 [Mycena sp. CBHHK59/15]